MNITYEDWRDFLYKVQAICSPAELQGEAVGHLCGAELEALREQWTEVVLRVMDIDRDGLDEAQLAALGALLEITSTGLRSEEYQFQLTLPADELPLVDRVTALSQWCQGFLRGLGSAAAGIGQKLDDDAKGFLEDLAAIAQAEHDGLGENEDEKHYAELVEYIRVAVISLYTQLHPPIFEDKVPPSSQLH